MQIDESTASKEKISSTGQRLFGAERTNEKSDPIGYACFGGGGGGGGGECRLGIGGGWLTGWAARRVLRVRPVGGGWEGGDGGRHQDGTVARWRASLLATLVVPPPPMGPNS